MAADGMVEPHSFDVIVLGTGLQEGIIAAAAAASRLSVLHLDPHDFYGAHWTSFDLDQFSIWAGSGGCLPVPPPSAQEQIAPEVSAAVDAVAGLSVDATAAHEDTRVGEDTQRSVEDSSSPDEQPAASVSGVTLGHNPETLGFEEIGLECGRSFFSDVQVSDHGVPLGSSRLYSIDLCGPRLTLCGSEFVNLLLRSGASNYVEFKGNDSSYIWTGAGFSAVPSSRADVFKDKGLSLPDKRHLMRFFSLVTDFASAEDPATVGIAAEDLECSFRDFLQRQRLPTSIVSILLYAIVLMDGGEGNNVKSSTSFLTATEGLHKLALYLSSVARFQNARGAFLYPFYGQGELPQAFCRSAAVNGALYVLRRPVQAILVDRDSKEYKGIRTFQGQDLFSKKLILGPSYHVATCRSADQSSENRSHETTEPLSVSATGRKRAGIQVARCVCITDRSLVEGQDTMLMIFPPHSVRDKWSSVIRGLQLGSTASVCPKEKYIIQFSTSCDDVVDGRDALETIVQTLFRCSKSSSADVGELEDKATEEPAIPILLWSTFYCQALHTPAEDLRIPGVSICKLPDETLDYETILHSSEETFREQFPNLDFFPQNSPLDITQGAQQDSEAEVTQDAPTKP